MSSSLRESAQDRSKVHKTDREQGKPKSGSHSESPSGSNIPKVRKSICNDVSRSKMDEFKAFEPDNVSRSISTTASPVKSGLVERLKGQSDEHSRVSSSGSSPASQDRSSGGSDTRRPLSPLVSFMADNLKPYLPERKGSLSSSSASRSPSNNKTSMPIKERVKDILFSPRKAKEQPKCVWHISSLQDRSGKLPALDIPQQWIRFSLPADAESEKEYGSWPGSESYTIEEINDCPLPLTGYVCSVAPPKSTGYQRPSLVVIFLITRWGDDRTEGQAKACIRILRILEGHALLSVNVEFDEDADRNLSNPQHQSAVKDMLENAVRDARV